MQAICTNALKLKPLHKRCCAYIRFCVYLLVCIDKNDGWGKQYNSHSGFHNRWAGKSWPHTALIRELFTQCGVVAVFRCAFVSDAKSWIAQNSTYTNYISSTVSRNTAAGDSVCPFHSLSPTILLVWRNRIQITHTHTRTAMPTAYSTILLGFGHRLSCESSYTPQQVLYNDHNLRESLAEI